MEREEELDYPAAVPDGMLTKQQLAARLRISVRHLEKLVRLGQIPRPVNLGRCVRFVGSAVNAWMIGGCPACASHDGSSTPADQAGENSVHPFLPEPINVSPPQVSDSQ